MPIDWDKKDEPIVPADDDLLGDDTPASLKNDLLKGARVLGQSIQDTPKALIGLGEVGTELVTGMFGAFSGTTAGAFEAFNNATNKAIQDDLDESVYVPDNIGKDYLKTFQEVTEALTIHPKTEFGQAYSSMVASVFEKFAEWGQDVGDLVLDETDSPGLATAADTSINAIPYVVPFMMTKRAVTSKGSRAKAESLDKSAKIKEITKEQQLEKLPAELETTTITKDVKPSLAIEELKIDQTVKLSKEQTAAVADSFKDGQLKTPIDVIRTDSGKLELVDKADGNKILMARELGDQPIKYRISESTKDAKRAEDASRAIQNDFDLVRSEFKEGLIKQAEKERMARKTILDKVKVGVFDTSSKVKSRLLEQSGDVGRRAVMQHELIAGATPKAQLKYQVWEDKIYNGMTKGDIQLLDQVIQSRRIIEIDKIKGEGKVKHPGNLTGRQHRNALIGLRDNVGKEKFDTLYKRSNDYFRATNKALGDLYVNGLITKKTYTDLQSVIYEPREFISRIDPVTVQNLGGKKITVHNSGLHQLGRGDISALVGDSRALLAEYMMRVENRIARNKANQALKDFAELVPDNGWVVAPQVTKRGKKGTPKGIRQPPGTVKVDVLVKGEQHPMFMDAAMAEQWITQSPQMTANMANMFRAVSGSMVVRPLATGYNPGFALVNFPRDIMHAYMASSEFSSHLPVFAMQMTNALKATMKDAWRKEGRFKDFINERGGLNFLTHQGTNITVGPLAHHNLLPRWRHIKETMSKLNEFSEVWTRLAIREQGLKNGLTPTEATWAARSYLDFSQGGKYAKALDHSIPYLNASIQAFRTTARRAVQDPKAFATKVMWLQGTAASIWLANYSMNPEGWAQVSPNVRRDNFVIMTPFSIIDDNGSERHLYFTVKKDNTMVPFTAMPELLLERYLEGRIPKNEMLEVFKSAVPIVPTEAIPPTISASMTYMSNHDFWTDDKIWKGPKVPPEQEFQIAPRKPTSPFFVDLGEAMGISPMRAERAAAKVFPQNPYTDLTGFGYKMMTQGMNSYDRSKQTEQILADTPIMRRIIGMTHPLSRAIEDIDSAELDGNAARYDLSRKVDNLYFRMKQGEIDGGERTIRTWISAQAPEERERLNKRLETQKIYDKVAQNIRPSDGVPTRIEWVRTGALDAVTRADWYYWKWRQASPVGRRTMDRMAGQLNSAGLGYTTEHFQRKLRQMKKTYGIEHFDDGELQGFRTTPR